MKTHSFSLHRQGFTLIELLVVITIIAILSALSMGGYTYIARKQADSQATIQISLLEKAIEEYKLDNGSYPPSGNTNSLFLLLYWDGAKTTPPGKIYLSDLDPATNKLGWTEGTGAAAKIVDPWGEEYIYTIGSSSKNPDFDLASKGKDGTIFTADDIDNY